MVDAMMGIAKATLAYETWLGKHIRLLPADLERKHQAMAQDMFPFLRATFYRWMQLWPKVCADEASAPRVLAVGDLHVENFGTWRDVKAGWCGASTILTKPTSCHTPSIWFVWPPARISPFASRGWRSRPRTPVKRS